MVKKIRLFGYLVLFFLLQNFAFAQEDPITVTGNELYGRVENGFSVREVTGNVVLRQGNVVITCDRAIQYLAQNNAHLIGRVVVTQDTLTIKTPEGYYYGNERRAFSDKGVILDDKKVVLTADIGEYFFKQAKADFRRKVTLTDNASVMNADRLLYFRKENRALAYSNVKITDPENIIEADSLAHYRSEKITYGYGNVRLKNIKDNTQIFGHKISDFRLKKYSIVEIDPFLMQVDTSYNDRKDSIVSIDTMMIRCRKMEAFRDTTDRFIATDSVRIVRGAFASVNDFSIYRRTAGQIYTYKMADSLLQPILWYEKTQLTGDSVLIHLNGKNIEKADISRQAMIISGNEFFPSRFDQVTGEKVVLHFRESRLHQTEIFSNVLSIYYLYEENEGNGLIKASAKDARINFMDSKVDEVHLYGEPKSEYHPENLISGKERQFTLPQFRLFENRPDKQSLFSTIHNNRLVR